MSEKSKVKINPTKFQKNLNAVCWILFLAFLAYSFLAWCRHNRRLLEQKSLLFSPHYVRSHISHHQHL